MQEVRQSKRAFPEGKALFAYFLLIIVVQEHRLDDHHLVVFLLFHLHICVQGLQAVIHGVKASGTVTARPSSMASLICLSTMGWAYRLGTGNAPLG